MQRLSEEAHGLDLGFAKVNDSPVILAGHGVNIALAQEANVVAVLKLADGRRVAAKLFVVELERANVLLSAMYQFVFAVTLNVRCDARDGYGQPDQDEHDHEEHYEKDEA